MSDPPPPPGASPDTSAEPEGSRPQASRLLKLHKGELWGWIVGVATVVGAAAAVWAIPGLAGEDPEKPSEPATATAGRDATIVGEDMSTVDVHGDVTVSEGCFLVQAGGTCLSEMQLVEDTSRTDEELRALLEAEFRNVLPEGAGPWRFIAVDVADPRQPGLIVRDSPFANGAQIGSIANRRVVYVTCAATTPFDPLDTDGVGSAKWANVLWPGTERTTAFKAPAADDAPVGWAYMRFLVPLGHNGRVPACPGFDGSDPTLESGP